MSKSEKNIDKLTFAEKLKLKTATPDGVMNLFEKKANKPESVVDYTPEDIHEKLQHEISHSLTSEQYEAELNEATTTLSEGAAEISNKLQNLTAPEFGEIIVEGEKAKQKPKIPENEYKNLEDDREQ